MAKSKIIKELANNQISMEVALQRLMIIASDLENEDLSAWAEAELHGYSRSDTLPKYRNIQSIHFVYSGINGSFKVTNCPFTFTNVLEEKLKGLLPVHILKCAFAAQHHTLEPTEALQSNLQPRRHIFQYGSCPNQITPPIQFRLICLSDRSRLLYIVKLTAD